MSSERPRHVPAIIGARGGSKGVPRKNLLDFCGLPLIAWTVRQAVAEKTIGAVWVSSDDDEILAVAEEHGARGIRRPEELSGDEASSESAWAHALDQIEEADGPADVVCALQATSPLRERGDLDRGLRDFDAQGCDSLFSAAALEDFNLWAPGSDGALTSTNFDYRARTRRQERAPQYLENGSFYFFRPEILRTQDNRLGGRIGISLMAFWKSFEIDDADDIAMCEALMRRFLP